ncbi:MAG: Spy/CpxP family protein refolding chaperone [Leptospirales bacterium]|nr:Spy/CpxP family protein refolding chaperone [Leptospirales bacterium]
MSTKHIVAGLLISGMTLGSVAGLAADPNRRPTREEHHGRPEHHGPQGPDLNRLAARLHLTAEQKQRAEQIRDRFRTQSQTQLAAMRPLRDQLRGMLQADQVNLEAVRAKLQELGAIHVELRMLHIQERLEFEALLTPQQRQQLRAMRPEHPGRSDDDGPGPGPDEDPM